MKRAALCVIVIFLSMLLMSCSTKVERTNSNEVACIVDEVLTSSKECRIVTSTNDTISLIRTDDNANVISGIKPDCVVMIDLQAQNVKQLDYVQGDQMVIDGSFLLAIVLIAVFVSFILFLECIS